MSQCLRMVVVFVVVGLIPMTTGWAESKVDLKQWQTLLDQAHLLRHAQEKSKQLLRAEKLWRAYTMHSKPYASVEAALIACSIRADFAKERDRIRMWAKTGWVLADQMIKRWPKRAEGYFWASIHIGQYARGGGVWVALTQGLAGKIEKMALTAVRMNPSVYRGAAQRVLGRYYFKIPWPWRKLKKSLSYLEEAHRLSPQSISGTLFLAETLWTLGQKKRAISLYRACAKRWYKGLRADASSSQCRDWLQKHGNPG